MFKSKRFLNQNINSTFARSDCLYFRKPVYDIGLQSLCKHHMTSLYNIARMVTFIKAKLKKHDGHITEKYIM